MLKKYLMLLILTGLILSYGCSSSEQSTQEEKKEDEVYVFDEIPTDSTVEIKQTEQKKETKEASYFIVQIGAYSTREKAEEFASLSRTIIPDNIIVTYNHEVNLFVVQLSEKFSNKNDVAKKRDNLRSFNEFKDAWVVTVY
jgi:cell division protein FtsN